MNLYDCVIYELHKFTRFIINEVFNMLVIIWKTNKISEKKNFLWGCRVKRKKYVSIYGNEFLLNGKSSCVKIVLKNARWSEVTGIEIFNKYDARCYQSLPGEENQPVNNSQSDVSFRAIFRYKWRNEVFILWMQTVVPFLVKAREMQKTYARAGAKERERGVGRGGF